MPVVFDNPKHKLAERIEEYSKDFPILDADNECFVLVDCFNRYADFCILDNNKLSIPTILSNKKEYLIENVIVRNYNESLICSFHAYIDKNNSILTFQDWDELLRYTVENIMEKVCFARN